MQNEIVISHKASFISYKGIALDTAKSSTAIVNSFDHDDRWVGGGR